MATPSAANHAGQPRIAPGREMTALRPHQIARRTRWRPIPHGWRAVAGAVEEAADDRRREGGATRDSKRKFRISQLFASRSQRPAAPSMASIKVPFRSWRRRWSGRRRSPFHAQAPGRAASLASMPAMSASPAGDYGSKGARHPADVGPDAGEIGRVVDADHRGRHAASDRQSAPARRPSSARPRVRPRAEDGFGVVRGRSAAPSPDRRRRDESSASARGDRPAMAARGLSARRY